LDYEKDPYIWTKLKFDNYQFLTSIEVYHAKDIDFIKVSAITKFATVVHANTSDNLKYAFVMPHNVIHRNSVHNQENCTARGKEVINVKPADENRGCIEEFRR